MKVKMKSAEMFVIEWLSNYNSSEITNKSNNRFSASQKKLKVNNELKLSKNRNNILQHIS